MEYFYELITGEYVPVKSTAKEFCFFIKIEKNSLPIRKNYAILVDIYQSTVSSAFYNGKTLWHISQILFSPENNYLERNDALPLYIDMEELTKYQNFLYSEDGQKMVKSYFDMQIFT
jgi:hypothetical protein